MVEIVIEAREFPSDRTIYHWPVSFEPRVVEHVDAEGRVWGRTVYPYSLSLYPFITEFFSGIRLPPPGSGPPVPAPWGPGPPEEAQFYNYLFTIWSVGWTRNLTEEIESPFPTRFIAYYVPHDSVVEVDTVPSHAVSLASQRVLDDPPVVADQDGVVSTARELRRVDASVSLRDTVPGGVSYFQEWTAWTTPEPLTERRPLAPGFIDRRLTLERNTVGRAVALYNTFPEPPGREPDVEESPSLIALEDNVRRLLGGGDKRALGKALQQIDEHISRLGNLRKLVKKAFDKAKR